MEFHLIVNGKQEGPFTIEELAQKGITPESEVWTEGMDDWRQAGDVPELTAVLQRAEFEAAQQASRAAEQQVTTGQPYNPGLPSAQQTSQAPPSYMPPVEPEKKRSGCTPWLIAALILAVLFATMVFTCPSRQAHEQAIQEVTKQWVGDKVDQKLPDIPGMGGVMGDIINKIVKQITGTGTDMAISNYLDVKNYVVCSVGRISVGDTKDKMVSLGAFGHVFTFDKEDLEKLWAQAMDEYESRHNITPPPTAQPQQDQDDPATDEEESVDPMALPDSIMGIEVPDGMDSMFNEMANEAIRMAKEWAKQQIDQLGK